MGLDERPPVHAAEEHPFETTIERLVAAVACGMTERKRHGCSRPRGERVRCVASVRRRSAETNVADEVDPRPDRGGTVQPMGEQPGVVPGVDAGGGLVERQSPVADHGGIAEDRLQPVLRAQLRPAGEGWVVLNVSWSQRAARSRAEGVTIRSRFPTSSGR